MMKNLLAIIVLAAIVSSCGSSSNDKKDENMGASIQFANLVENPDDYLDKDISIEGKVVHVCEKSGKKMFIVGEDPDVKLFISAGDKVAKFPMELLGSTVSVSGKLSKVEANTSTTEAKATFASISEEIVLSDETDGDPKKDLTKKAEEEKANAKECTAVTAEEKKACCETKANAKECATKAKECESKKLSDAEENSSDVADDSDCETEKALKEQPALAQFVLNYTNHKEVK